MSNSSQVPADIKLFGEAHVRTYRETNGEEGYLWNGVEILLLTMIGRKSGEERTVPLIFVRDGDNFAIIASRGGTPTHPSWYLNLEANPQVTLQVKDKVFPATARTAKGEERERIWATAVKAWPQYEDYQARTDRKIPVVVLEPGKG